ncbi:hypothetical protein B0H16DRAFT_1448572 [Mycena metata]|uniref:RING-type domain-containing protein n=1 Tax=Mycena metata TaxID=1033252 RepID=A0AAD7K5U6_9AGAR|nr:hypothetical protein B0H16DRAFT_1448572 [Mycena metata]
MSKSNPNAKKSDIHDADPNVRRKLNAPVAPARKKPVTAGRTNPLLPERHLGGLDRLRRLRPYSIATTRIVKRAPVVALPGIRELREEALTVEDLWRPGNPPPTVKCNEEDCCGICLQLRSHPVFYPCGHGHCYVCARIWFEQQWTCPECENVVTQPPFRIDAVDDLMRRIYGDWDASVVSYEWSGLTFPVLPTV